MLNHWCPAVISKYNLGLARRNRESQAAKCRDIQISPLNWQIPLLNIYSDCERQFEESDAAQAVNILSSLSRRISIMRSASCSHLDQILMTRTAVLAKWKPGRCNSVGNDVLLVAQFASTIDPSRRP